MAGIAGPAIMRDWKAGVLEWYLPFRVPHRHVPDQPAPPTDESFYKFIMSRFMDRLDETEVLDLLGWAVGKGMVMRVATACSGTDGPLLVWRGLAEAFRERFQKEFNTSHVFSSEKDCEKQSFIKEMFEDVHHLFTDSGQIGKELWRGQALRSVQQSKSYVLGFEVVSRRWL